MAAEATIEESDAGPARARIRELVRRVADTCDLPTLPAVAMRALTLARDPDARVDDLAKLVLTDGPLAARVLKISRSVLYARQRPPATMRDAILTVGFGALRKILIAASARSAYRPDDVVAQRLWEHALATALAADELAVTARQPRGGDSFIAGLLHDVGKLVFHIADPEGYREVAAEGEAGEEARFGVSHGGVGACLAQQWGLDDEAAEAILLHHAVDGPPLAVRLAAADRIAHELGYDGGVPEHVAGVGTVAAGEEHAALIERVTSAFATERTAFD